MDRRINRNTNEDAIDKFERKFSFPKKPAPELPDLPQHLDDLPDDEFMSVYSEFIAWVSYTKSELVKAEIEEDRAENAKRFIEAQVLIEQWGTDAKSSDRVTVAKARRDTDRRVVKQQEEYLQARAYRKLVESVFERCDRAAQLLSRELTRRTSTSPRDSRAARYGT
jgi:hypothetical protein